MNINAQAYFLNSGRLLVNNNTFYCGSSSNLPCQLALKTDIPNVTPYVHPSEKQCNYSYTHPSTIQCNAASEINNLKSSVSDGKVLIANAITGKGVTTSSSASFATMASNITSIAVTPVIDGAYRIQLSVAFFTTIPANTGSVKISDRVYFNSIYDYGNLFTKYGRVSFFPSYPSNNDKILYVSAGEIGSMFIDDLYIYRGSNGGHRDEDIDIYRVTIG